ncbi:MAG: MFS transporter, partial [bacterium]|nr:MFS transporter [bacterium]
MAKLPLKTKLIYGLGGLGTNLCDMVLMQWIIVRYAPGKGHGTILISGAVFAALLFLGRIGDGLYNIFMGHLSDNCRSPLGRRVPFVRRGFVPLAIVFFLLFSPPTGLPTPLLILWALVLIQAHFFLYATVVTPYLSLLPELTSDLNERVSLQILQTLGVVISLLIFGSMGIVVEHFGWHAVAGIVSVATILALAPVAFCIKEAPRPPDEDRPSLWVSIRLTMKNPAFRCIAASTAFFWFGLNLMVALVPMWVLTYLNEGEGKVPLVMLPYLGMTVLSAFIVFGILTKKFGKFAMFLFTLLGSACSFGLFAVAGWLPFGSPFAQTILAASTMGIPVAGFMVLPFALLADAIDYDEQLTGQRREAIFFGLQGVVQKLMIGISALTFGFIVYEGDVVTVTGLRTVAAAAA